MTAVALAADRNQKFRIALGAAVPFALGLEDVVRDGVDVGADALENVGAAVDHGVKQFHQHLLARHPRHAGPRQLVLDQGERPRLVIAHRHEAMAGEDEGHRRGLRRLGVGLAHQRRRHVARGVLYIETTGDLDLLHLVPRRHGDPGQILDRLVLGGGRIEEVDPHRVVRQRGEVVDGGFLQRRRRGNKHRKHGALRTALELTQEDLARFWQGLDDGRSTGGWNLWRTGGARVTWIRRPRQFAQKSAEIDTPCGKKATASVPQRGKRV
jgi:hypothetical protein